jgi:heme/copper-type cytochrome/quinol oxidase subunit 2
MLPSLAGCRSLACVAVLLGLVASASWDASAREAQPVADAQESGGAQRSFTISARKYAYAPARIEVNQDDLVKITLQSGDIAHSFTIDAYRIARRVGPGQTTVFEFRADRAGEFPFYCNLKVDDGCRQMKGLLIVRSR